MALARMIDLIVVYSIARVRYGFRLSARAVAGFVQAMVAGAVVVLSVLAADRIPGIRYCGFAVAAFVVVVSLYRLSRHGNLLSFVVKRIFRRFK